MIFFNGLKIRRVNKIIGKIAALNKININNKNRKKIKLKEKQLYSIISKYLFESARKRNLKILDIIIKSRHIKDNLVYNEGHLNIVEYSVFEGDNSLFKLLFYKYYEDITNYFNNSDELFMILLNKKNYDLIELFLTEELLYKHLKRENVSLCIYLSLKDNKTIITELILDNNELESKLKPEDIQTLLVYFITYNMHRQISKFFEYSKLIDKLTEQHIQNLLTIIIVNNDVSSLEIIIKNQRILDFILSNDEIMNNVLNISYLYKNIQILSTILKYKQVTIPKDNMESIEKEEN